MRSFLDWGAGRSRQLCGTKLLFESFCGCRRAMHEGRPAAHDTLTGQLRERAVDRVFSCGLHTDGRSNENVFWVILSWLKTYFTDTNRSYCNIISRDILFIAKKKGSSTQPTQASAGSFTPIQRKSKTTRSCSKKSSVHARHLPPQLHASDPRASLSVCHVSMTGCISAGQHTCMPAARRASKQSMHRMLW
jgi:hypothetical protein